MSGNLRTIIPVASSVFDLIRLRKPIPLFVGPNLNHPTSLSHYTALISIPTTTSTSLSSFTSLTTKPLNSRRRLTSSPAATMFHDNLLVNDICATAFSGAVALFFLRLWQETAKRGLEKKLNRKLVHISIGLAFMLCWPLFSPEYYGALLAALIPGVNIIRMLLLGLGITKDDATVKSMSRFGDHRELLKGPLYYATAITLASIIYWRTSPVSIAVICNLCAGDGVADIIGRRFGRQKIPYNKNKSLAGSFAMGCAGFLASLGYMFYFSSFGFVQKSWEMGFGFLVVSLASALVESLPISTELDDNLTVPLTSMLVGVLVF